jgi:RNA-directed DNA polymerase
VPRPWERNFLGYSFTVPHQTKLRIAPQGGQRFKTRLRPLRRRGRGRNLRGRLADLAPVLRGWNAYYRLTEVKGPLEDLDAWL